MRTGVASGPSSPWRRLSARGAGLVLGAFAIASAWTVIRDWSELLAAGGWFALLGRFLAVFATLVILFVAVVFVVALVLLPVFAWFALADPRSHEQLTLGRAPYLALASLREAAGRAGQRAYAAADRIWKLAWWLHWRVRRWLRSCR